LRQKNPTVRSYTWAGNLKLGRNPAIITTIKAFLNEIVIVRPPWALYYMKP